MSGVGTPISDISLNESLNNARIAIPITLEDYSTQ